MTGPPERRRLRDQLSTGRRAEELLHIRDRARQTGLLAVSTGVLTGLGVAGFERVIGAGLFDSLLRAPLWIQALGPAVGLTVAALVMRYVARGASPGLADEYIKDFHDPNRHIDRRLAPGSLVAGAATLAGGAALGFEGVAIYIGAVVGSWMQDRYRRFFASGDTKVLLVCGAAAGVAAIFKAPATGVVFALEVPYQQDLARRMLLPAMFAAAASYVVFVSINGTAPLFPIGGAPPPFDLRDIVGAAVVGLMSGALARVFTALLKMAKQIATQRHAVVRVAVASLAILGTFVGCRLLTGESLTLGSGYLAIRWALQPDHAIVLVVAIFVLRAIATVAAVAAGGVGGLFIPLVVQGSLLGGAVGGIIDSPNHSLFPVLGVAAFLGVGYRVPLAAIMFVAEATGRPGFIVPGLIAAASSQLFMGASSASAYQRDTRVREEGLT